MDKLGPFIAVLKTHIDILDDFSPAVIDQLCELSARHQFQILEDRFVQASIFIYAHLPLLCFTVYPDSLCPISSACPKQVAAYIGALLWDVQIKDPVHEFMLLPGMLVSEQMKVNIKLDSQQHNKLRLLRHSEHH